MRWPTRCSNAGRSANHTASPATAPAVAPDRADGRPVGQHHSTNLAIRRPDRPDHAQRPEPSLRHYREARDRQQADEREPDGGKQQHGQRLVPLLLRRGLRPSSLSPTAVPLGGWKRAAADPLESMSRVRLDGELICPGAIRAKTSCRFFGFSTMPTTRRVRPLHRPAVADREAKCGRDRRRHCDLAGTTGVTARHQVEHGRAVLAVRILGAQIDRIDRAGHRDVRMLDRFDGAKRLFGRGDVSARLRTRIGDVDPGVGRPGERLFGGLHVHDQPKPDDGRCDRYGEQGEYEELLAPLAAKQPPGPPRYGPASRATPARSRRRDKGGWRWRRQGAWSSRRAGFQQRLRTVLLGSLVHNPSIAQEHHPVRPGRRAARRG